MTEHTMTAEQARTFGGYSSGNALVLARAAKSRGCQCRPYEDWFTYKRWAAQGYQVKRGEHGVKIMTFISSQVEDTETHEVKVRSRPWTAAVFCRCQVQAR